MPWFFEWDGEVYREGDLTINQAKRIEEITGQSWVYINPIRSATHSQAIISVLVSDRTGVPVDAVMGKVDGMRARDVINAIQFADDDDLPTHYEDSVPTGADPSTTS